jgi:hypothetical protein
MTVDAVRHALLEAGAIVDEEYGVITVNPKDGDFVLRAEATAAQVEKLSKRLPLEFFPDVAITPTGRGTS